MTSNNTFKKSNPLISMLLLVFTIQLSGCVAKKELSNYSSGTYWTNKNYLVSPTRQFSFTTEEHLFQLSDSLVVHQALANNQLTSNRFEIAYVSHKSPYEIIYYAKKYFLLFQLDKKKNSLKVFTKSPGSLRKGLQLVMTHTNIHEVEEIPTEYALHSTGRAKNK